MMGLVVLRGVPTTGVDTHNIRLRLILLTSPVDVWRDIIMSAIMSRVFSTDHSRERST